jgi:hypothetical protein
MQADDEPQYPYPVYDSFSSEFESVLSSKEWVSDVNNEHLLSCYGWGNCYICKKLNN